MMACGNKTKSEQPVADSTTVEIPDTLYTVEAVINQVNAVYEYWNQQRLHYDEKAPTVDERFGSKEWNRVRDAVAAIDRECECGGFFDFGDEGPLDAWVYDCYEGTVSANDIQVQLQSDSTANVHFLVKDAVTTKGVPIRWTMRAWTWWPRGWTSPRPTSSITRGSEPLRPNPTPSTPVRSAGHWRC